MIQNLDILFELWKTKELVPVWVIFIKESTKEKEYVIPRII